MVEWECTPGIYSPLINSELEAQRPKPISPAGVAQPVTGSLGDALHFGHICSSVLKIVE